MTLSLRPYQQQAITEAANAIRSGKRSPLIVAPTGAGKTRIGTAIAASHIARSPKNRVLWLAHRAELLDQAGESLGSAELDCGYIDGTSRKRESAPVQIGSVQTLLRRETLPATTLTIFDEAHHMVADEWGELRKRLGTSLGLGLTATPERGDGRGLGESFDHLVVAETVKGLTRMGFLVPCEVKAPPRKLKPTQIAMSPLESWKLHAEGQQAIVFCDRVMSSQNAAASFVAAGVTAEHVDANTPYEQRRRTLAAFKRGEIKVLTNVYVLTEGFDAPATSCCILARGCGTTGMFLQMVGRVLRPSPGKTSAILLDLRGVVHDHGNPDDDREYSLDGKGISGKTVVPECRLCPICQLAYDGSYCPDCGESTGQQQELEVANVALEKFAGKRSEGDDKRVATLARWLLVASAKGHKPGAALYRYKATYGAWPPGHIVSAANRRNQG